MCFIALRPDFNTTLTQICNIVCLGIRCHSLHLTLFGRCLSCNLPRKVWCSCRMAEENLPFLSFSYMFWTDWGNKSKIEKCGMNGDPKSRHVIVNKNVGWPNGLTIDYTLNRIWWTDAKTGLETIESADLNGNHRRIVLKSGSVKHPFGISVFQDSIYWTDWNGRRLLKANKFTGGEEVELVANLLSVMNLVVFHQQRQPLG